MDEVTSIIKPGYFYLFFKYLCATSEAGVQRRVVLLYLFIFTLLVDSFWCHALCMAQKKSLGLESNINLVTFLFIYLL